MTHKDLSITIELLPEFGWSINNQPVYGPGSVFQGFIKLKITKLISVESIRIAFYATESILPFDISFGTIRVAKNILFSTQITLWESSKDNFLDINEEGIVSFPFTIQMPMIQFPPSLNSKNYENKYQLIAIVDAASRISKHIKPIIYMPYIETSVLKSPMILCSQANANSSLSAKLKITVTEFVPGDIIPISLHVGCSSASRKLRYVIVRLRLIQKIAIKRFQDIPDNETTVASVEHKLLLLPNDTVSYCDGDFTLQIPSHLAPTFNYGNLAETSYKLQCVVEQKGPLGGIWNYTTQIDDIPITLGTLGYGIRASSEFINYSQFALNQDNRPIDMPYPQFMKSIEYEDALPIYDPTRLPGYTTSTTIC